MGFTIIEGNADVNTNIMVNGATIYRNTGGGIFTFGGTNTLTNNSLSGNSASGPGGGIYYTQIGTHTLTNNIIWGNSSGIYTSGGDLTVTYSIVQGSFTGEGNMDEDPLFVDQPAIGLGTSGDLRLQACSPAINAGDDVSVPVGTTDLDGNDRIFDGTVDMGGVRASGSSPPTP